jgi:hypothetical protein
VHHPIRPPDRLHHHDLVIALPVFGRRSIFVSPDRAELLDAAHELACGHLPSERCSCRTPA